MKKLTLTTIALSALSFFELSAKEQSQIVELAITEKGYEPKEINVKPGVPTILKVTRKTDSTCATQIQVPSKKIKKDLPLNQIVELNLGKLEKGEVRFGCGMDMMMSGQIFVR
jgi:plastocyanin domain-containing protein